MSTMLQHAEQAAGTQLNRVRWAVGLNGALSIAFGIAIIVWPGISLFSLVIVFGAFARARGVAGLGVAIGGAFWLPLSGGDSALLGLTGLVEILFGIVMFAKPGAGAIALLALIAAYALIIGLTEVTVAIAGERLFSRELRNAFSSSRTQTSH